jgi:lauroyl/myristoyl acyltransferase
MIDECITGTSLTNLECWHELRQRNKQKVEVEEELELFPQHQGKEGKEVVLLVPHNVGWEASLQLIWDNVSSSSSRLRCGTHLAA